MMMDALLALLLLTGMVGATYLIGRVILSGLMRGVSEGETSRVLPFGERLVFAVPLGIGVIGYIVLALGLLGVLNPVVFGALLAVGLPGWYFLFRDSRSKIPSDTPASSFGDPLPLICTLTLLLLGFFTFIGALAPPAGLEWDSLSYHLAAPKVYLQQGRITLLPWDHHSNFPFTLQMLYMVMLGLGSIGAAKLIHWLCGVLLILSVWTFANRFLAPRYGQRIAPVAAVIAAAVPIFLWEATTAYVDLATALFTYLSFYSYWVWRENRTGNGGLLLSAMLMGFALGTKYTVLGFWGLLLLGIFVVEVVSEKRLTGSIIAKTALWGAVALAIGAPWYIKNVVLTGNPVYPFAYEIFGGKYWSLENAQQYSAEQGRFGMGKTPLDLLLSPWNVTQEAGVLWQSPEFQKRGFVYTEYIIYGFGLSPVFLGLLVLTPFVGRQLAPASRACVLFGLGIYLFWFFVMQQTRYLLPALPALAVLAAETLFLLREVGNRAAAGMGGALIAGSALWSLFLMGGLSFWGVTGLPGVSYPPVWNVVSGQISQKEFVEKRLPGLGPASFWINENTPKDAGVALFEVRGFYLDRPYLWAQPDHAAGLLPWDEYKDVDDWLADFKNRGLTTLVLGIPLESEDGKRWRSLLAEAIAQSKVNLVFEDRTVQVFRIP
ncbi:MAG: hypothetical protein OHK0029_14640 [Armatimonadaceae bacterium]